MPVRDLTGQRFGRLVVLNHSRRIFQNPRQGYRHYWNCQCDCGTTTEVLTYQLTSGHTRSCGCLQRELTRVRFTKHGQHGTLLYMAWLGMHERCRNPKHKDYKYYGALGIKVCEPWRSFENYSNYISDHLGDRQPGMTLDRIDSTKDYEPGNVRWATHLEQRHNQQRYKDRRRRQS